MRPRLREFTGENVYKLRRHWNSERRTKQVIFTLGKLYGLYWTTSIRQGIPQREVGDTLSNPCNPPTPECDEELSDRITSVESHVSDLLIRVVPDSLPFPRFFFLIRSSIFYCSGRPPQHPVSPSSQQPRPFWPLPDLSSPSPLAPWRT